LWVQGNGSWTAETLAKAGIETYLFERKLDNAKPCGGAIPLCMVSEFDLPPEIIESPGEKNENDLPPLT
jgi:geranylgeranyl reductase